MTMLSSLPLNIDWQQILLHVFNFIILATVLTFVLFKPVRKFMREREEKYKTAAEEHAKKKAEIAEMEEERKARSQMSENIAWQDKIDRAAGILKTARVLSSSECMELLSYIRLGLSTGVLQGVTTQELNALMVNAQPATLMAKAGKQLDQNQRDILRAQMAREACAKIKE